MKYIGHTPLLVSPLTLPTRMVGFTRGNQGVKSSCEDMRKFWSLNLALTWVSPVLLWAHLANNCDRITTQGSHKHILLLVGFVVFLLTSSWSNICCFSFSANWLCWLISSSCNEIGLEAFSCFSQVSFDCSYFPLSSKNNATANLEQV